MNFEIRKSTGKEEYQFFLVDKNKRILTSDTFTSRDACTDAIKSLINSGGNANNYQVAQDGNDHFMTISTADGSPLALSSAFSSAAEAEDLKEKLPNEFFDDREFEVTFVTTRVQRRKSTEKIEMYDLSHKSSGKKGFDTYKNGKIFYFAFNNDNGEIILYGRAQKTGTKRKADIWHLIIKAAKDDNYETKEADGGYYFIFKDRKGKEMARSVVFSSQELVTSSISTLKSSVGDYKAEFSTADKVSTRKKRKKSGPNDDYDFTQVSKSGKYGFEAFRNDENKGNYFHFNDDDGNAVLYSQNYSTPKSRDNGIRSVIKNGAIEGRYLRKTKDEMHYFIIKAGNNQEIARSKMFTSIAAMNAFMLSMRTKVIGFAEAYGLDKDVILSSIVTEKEVFTLERDVQEEVVMEAAPIEEVVVEKPQQKDDDYLKCNDYKGHTRSEAYPDFSTFDHEDLHYFALLNAADTVLLRSEGYTTIAARDNGIRSVLKNKDIEARRKTIEKFGYYFVILKAGNHQEIGRSCAMDSEAAALALFVEPMGAHVAQGVIEDYLPCDEYRGHTRNKEYPDFATFEKDGCYFFVFMNHKDEIVLRSEAYTTTRARDNGVQSVLKNKDIEKRRGVIEEDGKYYAILKAGNHQEIGRSCAMDSEAAALALFAPEPMAAHLVQGVIEDYLPCSEYKGHPRNEEYPLFSTFEKDGCYFFAFLNDDDEIVLRSEAYTTTKARDNGMQSVLKNKDIEKRNAIIEEDGKYFAILKAGNHQEIGRSCPMEDEAAAAALALFSPAALLAAAAAPIVTIPEVEEEVIEEVVEEIIVEEPKDKEDDYLPCKEYQNRKVNDKINNVALFRHKKDNQFYFALYDENGEVKLRSEGFRTSQERDKELSGVLRFNKNPDMYERMQKGKYYMDILRDENGIEVGRSCLKKEEEDAAALVGAGLGAAGLGLVGIGDTPEVEEVVIEEEIEAAVPVVPVVPVPDPPKTIVDTSTYDNTEDVAAAAGAGAAAGGGAAGCMRYLPWLLLLALLFLLLLWLLRGCDGCSGAAIDTDPNVVPPATTEVVPDTTTNNAEIEATPEEYEALGPNAAELGFASGSVVAAMADCLADPNCDIPSKKFTLSIVHFGENDAHMNKAAYAEMDDLAKLMKAYPNMKLDIHGHIDNQESDVYTGRYQDGNITLSGIRARCVYRKLTDRGISGSRMKFTGHAATQPVTSGTSNADRIKNRRVEVVISQR